MALNNRQRVFVEEYLKCWNASEAARRAGYIGDANTVGPRLLANVGVAEAIRTRIDQLAMSADEILIHLTEQARGDLGVFYKIVEEWTFYPLPTYEIIDAKEVVDDSDPNNPRTRVSYWVRHAVVDMDKVTDPRYSHLLAEFSDSPRDGITIKPYSKQAALQQLARIRGMVVNKTELTGKNGGPVEHVVKNNLARLTDEELAALEQIRRKLDADPG